MITSSDGEDGYRKVTTEKPDCIVMDIKMPKIDGLSLAKELKRNPSTKDIFIVVLTGYDGMRDLFAFEGIKDYFVKPFKAEDLLEKINHHFKTRV